MKPGLLKSNYNAMNTINFETISNCGVAVIKASFTVISWGGVSGQKQAPHFDAEKFVSAFEDVLANDELMMSYTPRISREERIAGLSLLWSEAKFNFVNFDLIEINLDSLYLAYIPKVSEEQSTLEYTRVLQSFYAHLKDGHTGVRFPGEVMKRVNSMPGVLVEQVEGKAVITDTVPGYVLPDGVSIGDVIYKVEGVPVNEYIKNRISPFVSASTPQDSIAKIFKYDLLQGDADEEISLTLKNREGKLFIADFPRMNHQGWLQIGYPAADYRVLENNIGYLILNTFNNEAVVPFFESRFDQILKTDALIIDVRQNSGGSTHRGIEILSHLTDRNFTKATSVVRKYDPAARRWGEPFTTGRYTGEIEPHGERKYSKPVVLLIGASTYSAAEDFTVAFRQAKRGVIMGVPTAGSTGQPYHFRIPGGGLAYVCTIRDYFNDGTEFIGTGILPDITVRRSLDDLHNGKDTLLEAAIRRLAQ